MCMCVGGVAINVHIIRFAYTFEYVRICHAFRVLCGTSARMGTYCSVLHQIIQSRYTHSSP